MVNTEILQIEGFGARHNAEAATPGKFTQKARNLPGLGLIAMNVDYPDIFAPFQAIEYSSCFPIDVEKTNHASMGKPS